MTKPNLFKWFKTSPEIIRLAVMMYVRYPRSLRNVDSLLHKRDACIPYKTMTYTKRCEG
jgi:putative transposase